VNKGKKKDLPLSGVAKANVRRMRALGEMHVFDKF